ncbi:hypothetical protein K458DRAFT_167439 [Lentithecium fluviatile CBS 122367]|uniref:Uncharacterized protein n=1 Tax=Lentithecium fluviatile CBS 122367 TaxID=1168545 RepID=A0A6G1JAR7_9PLEO|nr:hypothetical protein K458DRAFT_167439 [Lentithecium fluviatile CBS 122367]
MSHIAPSTPEDAEDGDKTVRCRVHTKCATPAAVLKVLEVMVGRDNYRIEMRHNVYNITITTDVDKRMILSKLAL